MSSDSPGFVTFVSPPQDQEWVDSNNMDRGFVFPDAIALVL